MSHSACPSNPGEAPRRTEAAEGAPATAWTTPDGPSAAREDQTGEEKVVYGGAPTRRAIATQQDACTEERKVESHLQHQETRPWRAHQGWALRKYRFPVPRRTSWRCERPSGRRRTTRMTRSTQEPLTTRSAERDSQPASRSPPLFVPHPVSWTHVCATRHGVARIPRALRAACDTPAFRGASTGCSVRRTRRRRRALRRGCERPGRRSLAP